MAQIFYHMDLKVDQKEHSIITTFQFKLDSELFLYKPVLEHRFQIFAQSELKSAPQLISVQVT